MSAEPAHTERQPFLRLIRYAKPYGLVLFGAIACAALFAGGRTGRLVILRPILEEVRIPSAAADVGVGDLLDAIRGETKPAQAGSDDDDATRALLTAVERHWPRFALAMALTLILVPLAHFGQEYLSQHLLGRVLVDLQRDLCGKLLRLPLRFHQQTPRGETLSRILNDTSKAHLALDQFFVDVVQSGVMLVVILAALFLVSWQLTFAVGIAAPILGGAIAYFGAEIRRRAERRQESQAHMTQRLLQILAGIKIVKAFKAQDGEARSFAAENLRYFRRNLKVMKNRAAARSVVEFLSSLVAISIFLVGFYAVVRGVWGLSFVTLVLFSALMIQAYRPMRDFSRAWTRLQEAIPSASRFFDVLDAQDEEPDAVGAAPCAGVQRGIALRDVSFSYGREPVLKNVSVEVSAGEMVAIVGKTGSGKTTLADLLLRLYDPDQGAIEVDGVDLRKIQRGS